MRETKFRAWNGERMKEVLTWGFNERFISTPKETSPQEDLKVMQYTGLKDKNGKEIYEGDIVEWESKRVGSPYGVNEISRAVVKFENQKWSPWLSEFMTVIGNIYENPELLSTN